jgi:hypothetical protein
MSLINKALLIPFNCLFFIEMNYKSYTELFKANLAKLDMNI